jgi:hypothetical protein
MVFCQSEIAITLIRPSKFTGSAAKINVRINEKEVVLRNGESSTVNCVVAANQPITIYANSNTSKEQISFNPIEGENYSFEIGFDLKGVYITKLSGEMSVIENEYVKDSKNSKVKRVLFEPAFGAFSGSQSESEQTREEWLRKGGKVRYMSGTLNVIYFSLNSDDFGKMNGYGAGYSAFYNFFKLKLPEYKTGKANWNSFNWGFGYDFLMYSFKYSIEEDLFRMNSDILTVSLNVTGELGWTLGLGKFYSRDQWKGVALILKYRPSLNLTAGSVTTQIISSSPWLPNSNTTSSIDPTANLNLGGFGFDVQFSNFHTTMDKLAPRPSMKFSAFILPPIGDNPLFISAGVGFLIYKRRNYSK